MEDHSQVRYNSTTNDTFFCPLNNTNEGFRRYSLRPKILVILKFKICHKKQVTLIYLESIYAYKNQLVLNMDNI